MLKLRGKKGLVFGGILGFLTIAFGFSSAYNMDGATISNSFGISEYRTITTEEFTSPTNWTPCEKVPKTITVKNESSSNVKVRLSYNERWESETGARLGLSHNGSRLVELEFQNESDWESRDGFYYYKNELAPGEETSSLFKNVVLSCDADLGHTNVCSQTASGIVCAKPDDPYENAKYHLNVKVESLQASAADEEWFNSAYLDAGSSVNDAFVQLAGANDAVQSISFVDELPDSINPDTTEKVLISIEGSTPIYAYDNGDHNIIIHSEAKTIYANSNSYALFRNFPSLTSLHLSENFNTSLVTNMKAMFGYLVSLTSLDLPESFDTSSVTDMSLMFYDEESLTSLSLPESFNTSSVTNMNYMFAWSKPIASLHIPEAFDTTSVTNMNGMFGNLISLTSLTLPSAFIPSAVTDMGLMFYGMSSLTSLNLPDTFDTSSATNMEGVFYGASSLTTLTLPNAFSTASTTDIRSMFYGMTSLSALTLPPSFTATNKTTGSLFGQIPTSATLNSSADSSVKSLWPGTFRND